MENLLDKMIYKSKTMQQVRKELKPFIHSASPILFWGEPGSGMGFYARAIHEASREGQKFLREPGFELEEDTVTQQFLGIGNRTGWLKETDNGTIFLNRIEDPSLAIQQTLSQLIANQSSDGRIPFSPTRSTETLQVNVRFIFSMAYDFDVAIQDKLLHRDLVDVLRKRGKIIHLPPLRERKEDIVAIAKNFFEELNQEYHQQVSSLDKKAQKMLTNYNWPGNIDELRRELAGIFSRYPGMTTISAEHIPEHIEKQEITRYQYIFKFKDQEEIRGKFLSNLLNIRKDKVKLRINTGDIVEIIRVEDDFLSPPRFKHFTFKLKGDNTVPGLFLDKTIKIETAFDPQYHVDIQNLSSVELS